MKQVIGSALGIFALGIVLMAFGLIGGNEARATGAAASPPAVTAAPAGFNSSTLGDVRGQSYGVRDQSDGGQGLPAALAGGSGSATLVNCEPGQHALVREVVLNGQPVSQVDCVGTASGPAVAYARPVSDIQVVPAVTTYRVQEQPRVASAPRRTAARSTASRGWKKPALIIGGSTAAGAGIGGLVGGKKGALIGAALGGGASTIYEATRR